MGLFGFKSAKERFIEANAVPEDKAPLLCYGAMLIRVNQQPPETLKMQKNKGSQAADILSNFWQVTDSASAQKTIKWLLEEGDRIEWDSLLAAYSGGDDSALDNEARNRLDTLAKEYDGNVVHGGKITKESVRAVSSIIGWDIERAAFVARCAYNAGYISEDEAWRVLELVKKAAKDFATWTDYMVSYCVGRGLIMKSASSDDNNEFLWSARLLEWEKNGIWRRFPKRS